MPLLHRRVEFAKHPEDCIGLTCFMCELDCVSLPRRSSGRSKLAEHYTAEFAVQTHAAWALYRRHTDGSGFDTLSCEPLP